MHGSPKVIGVRTPPSPGPFVNAKLLSLGCDAGGVERFWTSAFGRASGAIGVVVDTQGNQTPYRFGRAHECLYSAAPQNGNTLWLCGDLAHVVRLSLDTGMIDTFDTGTESNLPFAGMAYDDATGRLFLAANPNQQPSGFSFDTRTKKAVQFRGQWLGRYHYNSFPNGDGTWTLPLYLPAQLLRWDPRTNEVRPSVVDIADIPLRWSYRFAHAESRGWYIPTRGWYDAPHDRLRRGGPRPPREMLWFGACGDRVFGCEVHGADMIVSVWDMRRGRIDELTRLADTMLQGVTLTRGGDVAAISMYGDLRIIDGDTGAMTLARRVTTMPRAHANNLRLIDRDRLLGTTFITQRFWEADLATGRSRDCGRAAPDSGQITQTWRIGGRIYMAAYHGGDLVEYDPQRPAAYPTNPRPVASHPLAMRPVAAAHAGHILWYACSRDYGIHGSVILRHDTRRGTSTSCVDPLGPRQVLSLLHNPATGELLCGSTIHADQASAEPVTRRAALGRLNADDLALRDVRETPTLRVDVIGWVRRGVALCVDYTDDDSEPYLIDGSTLDRLDAAPIAPRNRIAWTGRVGRFVLEADGRLELHDLRRRRTLRRVLVESLHRRGRVRWSLDGDNLMLMNDAGDAWVVRDALAGR